MFIAIITLTIFFLVTLGIVAYLDAEHEKEELLKNPKVGSKEFFELPQVKRQINGVHRMYMQQTIMALWQGERPPHSVGGYGTLTKKKLIIEWNDEWQSVMDRLSEYHDISYNILFDIPEEYPEAGIILTTEEILAEYGEEKES